MKQTRKIASAAILVFAATGCATVTPEQQAKWGETAPICYTEPDCKTKWAAARDWIHSNAGYKIQIYSDDLIETYNSAYSDPKIAVRAAKKPLGKDAEGNTTNVINVTVSCGNMFGCVPSANEAITSFNHHVSQAEIEDPSCYSKMLRDSSSPKVGFYTQVFRNSKIVVKRVCRGAPGHLAGLQPNDVITAINGVRINNPDSYNHAGSNLRFGDKLNVEVLRDDRPLSLTIQLLSKEEHDQMRARSNATSQKDSMDVEKKLESLSRMLEKGLVSKDEFEAKKKQLLQDM